MTLRHILLIVVSAVLLFTVHVQAEDISLSLPWEKSWPVISPKTAGTFGFTLKNDSKEPSEATLQAEFTSPSGQTDQLKQTVLLAPAETKSVPYPLTGKEFGSWQVRYKLISKGATKPLIDRKITFGYFDPMGPNNTRPSFMFGIVSHSERRPIAERHRELEAAAYVGCKILRAGPEWSIVQPASDQWNWETLDDMVETTAQLGYEIEALLAFTPRWAAPFDKQNDKDWLSWNRATPDLTSWRTYVSTAANRYKGRIRLWETWNEPDLAGFYRGTTEEYIEMLKISIEELRKVDPKNVVMSGGFATLDNHPSRSKNPDLQERTMRALGPQLDVHAVHEHGPFDRFATVVDRSYAALRASLPKPVPPLFFNETADHSMNGTEKAQAITLVKKASFARSRGAIGYLWYDLRNDGTDLHDPEHHFGLLTHSMEPKPAYIAFNTFARLIVPRPYLSQINAGDNRWFFLFGDDAEKVLVFWNDDYTSQNEQQMLKLPGCKEAALVDLNGNRTPLALSGELAIVSVGSEPHYLVAKGAKAVTPAGRLAGPARAFFGPPGGKVDVSCEFANPTATPVEVQTDWAVPTTMQLLQSAPAKTIIPAGSRIVSTVTVQLPEGDSYQFGRDGKLRVNYQYAGLPYQGRILIPVQYGTISVPADAPNRKPDIVLDQPSQLISFIEADPHMVPFRWKGPEDLSAKIWFAATPKDLLIRVIVTDNKHHLTGAPADMWRGDSIQCLLALPGQSGTWELGFGENNDGKPLVASWSVPSGLQDCAAKIRVEVTHQGEGRTYIVALPRQELGLSDKMLREGFRLNLAVNDNDGEVRAHALQIASGLVNNKSISAAPYIVFPEYSTQEKP